MFFVPLASCFSRLLWYSRLIGSRTGQATLTFTCSCGDGWPPFASDPRSKVTRWWVGEADNRDLVALFAETARPSERASGPRKVFLVRGLCSVQQNPCYRLPRSAGRCKRPARLAITAGHAACGEYARQNRREHPCSLKTRASVPGRAGFARPCPPPLPAASIAELLAEQSKRRAGLAMFPLRLTKLKPQRLDAIMSRWRVSGVSTVRLAFKITVLASLRPRARLQAAVSIGC